MLTETQFRAEQAVLAGYEALTSGNENIVDGTVTEPIPTTNGTIEKDSYIRTASTTRGGDVPVEMKIIFTPTGTETESITVDITGSAADANLTGFTADTYTATSGSETKEFDSTPSVFIAKNSNNEILQMINACIKNETVEAGFTIDEEASFINGNNPSWIIFTNPAIDSATHKVNFTPVDGTVSNFSLDDCLDVSEADVAISDAPAYKSEGLPKEDQDALNIGFENYAYAVLFHPEGIDNDNYTESTFFESAKILDISVTNEYPVMTINIDDGTNDVHMVVSEGTGDISSGYCSEFTINGENYSYLRDSLYKRFIALYCSIEYQPQIVTVIMTPGEGITQNGNVYTLTDVEAGITMNGTITADYEFNENTSEGYMNFETDLELLESEDSAPIKLKSAGRFEYTNASEDPEDPRLIADVRYTYVNLPSHGGEASEFELDLINRCLYARTHRNQFQY